MFKPGIVAPLTGRISQLNPNPQLRALLWARSCGLNSTGTYGASLTIFFDAVAQETHTIRFEIKPNDTGKCRVVTLVLKDSNIVNFPEISEFGNNAIRIFQRAK